MNALLNSGKLFFLFLNKLYLRAESIKHWKISMGFEGGCVTSVWPCGADLLMYILLLMLPVY